MEQLKPKKVYLIRHGAVRLPGTDRCYLGQTDVMLSEEGERQAVWLKRFFQRKMEEERISCVYHSPLSRCRITAEVIAEKRIPCVSVSGLKEINMGSWEMIPHKHVKEAYPILYDLRGETMDTFCPPHGESFRSCQKRAVRAFNEITEKQQNCIIVAHAGVNRAILSELLQRPLRDLLQIPQQYASVQELYLTEDGWTVGAYTPCDL